jgi:hypothetical protein
VLEFRAIFPVDLVVDHALEYGHTVIKHKLKMSNNLSLETKTAAVSMLCEGNSIRALSA